MKRRKWGTGTIEKTKDGRFRPRLTIGENRIDVGGPYDTYKEAEAALDGMLAELREQQINPRTGPTLKSWAKRVLENREKEGYRSVGDQWSIYRAHIEKWPLAAQSIKTITRLDVKEWLVDIAAKGRSLQTRRNILNTLRCIFEGALDADQIENNPCFGLKIKNPGKTEDTSTWLRLPEALRFMAIAKSPAVNFAIGTGMRQGEQRSLEWRDVHLNVEQPYVYVRFGAPGMPPKNGKPRKVPLFGIALEAVKQIPRKGKLVFPAKRGGYRMKGRMVVPAHWRQWVLEAKVKRRFRWHDLRHTCATLLLTGAWGRAWSYEEVKDMLGHSSVRVTERYARALGLAFGAAMATQTKPEHSPKQGRKK